jgi:hypothetical protein
MRFMSGRHPSIKILFLLFTFIIPFIYYCSSETGGNNTSDAADVTGLRFCKNSAQCKPDEECINNVCQKRGPVDAESDIYVDVLSDATDVYTDISEDTQVEDVIDYGIDSGPVDGGSDIPIEYKAGIGSIYEGSAGECEDGEYVVKSVSGYGGTRVMEDEDYKVYSGARFKR